MPLNDSQKRWGYILALIFFASVLRLLALEKNSVTGDEIAMFMATTDTIQTIVEFCKDDNYPPLYFLLSKLSLSVSRSDFALRFPSALAGVLTVPLCFLALRRIFNAPIPIIASLLVCFNPYLIFFDRTAKMYSLANILNMLSLWALTFAIQKGGWKRWSLYSLLQATNLYSSYLSIPVLGIQFLYALIAIAMGETNGRESSLRLGEQTRKLFSGLRDCFRDPNSPQRRQLLMLCGSSFGATLLFLPWLGTGLTTLARNVGKGGPMEEISNYSLPHDAMAYVFAHVIGTFGSGGGIVLPGTIGLIYWCVAGIVFVVALIGCISVAQKSLASFVLVGGWVTSPFVFYFILQPQRAIYARYFVFIVPFFFALFCQGAVTLRQTLKRFGERKALSLAGFIFIVVGCSWTGPLYCIYFEEVDGWKPASRYLDQRLSHGDLVIGGYHYGANILRHSLPKWRETVGFMPMWDYLLNFRADPKAEETGLPLNIVPEDFDGTVWFVSGYIEDVPTVVWNGIERGFIFEKRFTTLLSFGDVYVYRRSFREAPPRQDGIEAGVSSIEAK